MMAQATTHNYELSVQNVAPVLNVVSGGSSTPSGLPLQVLGTVSDAGIYDEITGTVDFGDGVQLPLELSAGNFALSYQYSQSGQFEVTVTVRDLDGGRSEQTFVHNVDVNPAVITADSLVTLDTTPPLTGTIDDALANVTVFIGNYSYPALNNGDGTWSLPDNAITQVLGPASYHVRAVAVDPAGNISTGRATLSVLSGSNDGCRRR